jgi:DNA polymerase
VADYSQIEARIVAWYAGEKELLSDFAQNKDPYSKFASHVAGKPIRKPTKEDSPEVYKFLYNWRFLGKTCVLGSNYGLGAERLLAQLKNEPDIDPTMLTEELAERLIGQFRTQYNRIVKFWYAVQQLMTDANTYYQLRLSLNNISATVLCHKLMVNLPSGRSLFYEDFHKEGTQLFVGNKKIWGGVFVENIVQATARDVLAHKFESLEKAGLPVVYHIHDSVACLTPDSDIELNKTTMTNILCAGLPWTKGLPLDIELNVTKSFD